MKTKIILVPFVLLFLITACNSKQKKIAKRHIPTEKELLVFENQMASLTKELNIPGLSYIIVNESQVIQAKGIGYADAEKSTKADENTVCKIGAMGDVFAASLIMQLVETGKLDIKDNISEYVVNNKKTKNATIKQILSHTSGNKAGTEFIYDPSSFNSLQEVIKAKSDKSFSKLLKKKITNKLKMKNTAADENTNISAGCVSSVSDLAKFSMAVDNKNLFENENTNDLMFRPVYLNNGEQTPSALGWFVQFYNDKKYIWSFGQDKGLSSIILKSLTDSLTLIVLANSENLNAPFGLQQGNVFSSPVAIEFLKAFILRKDTLPAISIQESDSTIKNALKMANNSIHRDLLVNEFLSYVRMCQYMNQPERLNHLVTIYQQVLPLEVPWNLLEKEPRAIIKEAGDYVRIRRPFQIERDTTVNIFAVGEFVKEMTLNPWEYDIAEIYFDLKNEKKTSFDNRLNRQYRFDYDSPEVTGNFSTADNIKFAQGDPSKTSYLFEIRLPWKTLDSIKPSDRLRIGFDMNVTDNDGGTRKNFITWHFKNNEQAWNNPSVYGAMILCDHNKNHSNDSVCLSLKAKKPLTIDGKIENDWMAAPIYKLTKTISDFSKFPDKNDLSAQFRSEWDNDYLYVLIEVTDNYKYIFPLNGDYGWIENEKQDTIWIMQNSNSKYAGGAITNKYVNATIPLKAGNYILNYSSNQTNSFNRWIRTRPEISFYGIAVY